MAKECGGSLVDVAAVLNHDGRFAFIPSAMSIRVVSLRTGDTVRILNGHADAVVQVFLSPLNKMEVVSVSLDGTLKFWDYDDAICLKTISLGRPIASCHIVDGRNGEGATIYWVGVTKTGKKQMMFKTPLNTSSMAHSQNLSESSVLLQTVKTANLWGFHNQTATFVFSTGKTFNIFPAIAKEPQAFTCNNTITSLAVSNENDEAATGDKQGKITRWVGLFENSEVVQPLQTSLHWHAHGVSSIAYTNDGEYLLSGGEEGVLVLWQLATKSKRFLPRLGAPLSHLVVTNSNTYYIASLANNSILVISAASFEVIHKISGLLRSPVPTQRNFPAGLLIHPIHNSYMITNGTQGQLQMFDVDRDEHVLNIDVSGRNYISRTYHRQIAPVYITHTAITSDGRMIATVETRADKYFGNDLRLKFWTKMQKGQKFQVNTVVDPPHQKRITSFCSHPTEYKFLSTSIDGTIKLWVLVPQQGTEKSYWRCDAVVDYNHLPCYAASFTPDGEHFIVACKNIITMWETSTCELVNATELSDTSAIASALVVAGDGSRFIVSTQGFVCVFDTLTLDLVDVKKAKSNHLTAFIPNNKEENVEEKNLYAYSVGSKDGMGFNINICSANVNDVIRTINVRSKPLALSFKESSGFVSIVVLDSNQSLRMFLLTDDEEAINEFETMEKRNMPLYGVEEDNAGKAYRNLFAAKSVRDESSKKRTAMGEAFKPVSVKDLFDIPTHLLPPVSRLAFDFLDLMLKQRGAKDGTKEEEEKNQDDSEDEDEEIATVNMKDSEDEEDEGEEEDEDVGLLASDLEKVSKNMDIGSMFEYKLTVEEQNTIASTIDASSFQFLSEDMQSSINHTVTTLNTPSTTIPPTTTKTPSKQQQQQKRRKSKAQPSSTQPLQQEPSHSNSNTPSKGKKGKNKVSKLQSNPGSKANSVAATPRRRTKKASNE
eukprot:m.20519 g.20519  ORF g.20519 m.20519 type:complete len:940 (-) comp5257_c0_seq1:98-2917(-)